MTTLSLPPPHPRRQPGRHRGRVLRFLHLRDRRRAGVRAAVLPGGSPPRRSCCLRYATFGARLRRPPGRRDRVRPFRRPDRAQVDAGRLAAADGRIDRRDRLPADLCAGRLDRAARCCACCASARASGLAANGAGRRCSRSRMRRRAGEARFGMFPQLGAPVGFIAANGLFLMLGLVLDARRSSSPGAGAFRSCCSAMLVGLGLWVRLKLTETPAFLDAMRRGAAARCRCASCSDAASRRDARRHVRRRRLLRALSTSRPPSRLATAPRRSAIRARRSWRSSSSRSCSWRAAYRRELLADRHSAARMLAIGFAGCIGVGALMAPMLGSGSLFRCGCACRARCS